ncbi:serine/arginine repetitive matrix protein 1-like [Penaeus monodon]|uniref:serine/arginine repetitive matrix protein 1-like n=1 Tax=Penaeus monodon TaxID=6687 RepID=UPI0018A76F9D|nr:serine/arginine repetitive matrix protein 1-like [Penaeus monodon]
MAVLYWWYRRRPQREASLRSRFVAATIDGGDELRLSAILADLRASTSQAFRCPERPPPPWPDPLLEYFRQRPIARPTRAPPSPPQETRPRRRAKRRRRHKAHRRSAHPVTRRKSLVGACAEAPLESGSGEATAAKKENRADASVRRTKSAENDYAHGRGLRRSETRVFRKGSGRRRSLRRGRLVPLEARPAAAGRTPKHSRQKHSAEGLHRPEDYEDVLPGPLGSPTPSFASQREILTPPPSPPLRPPGGPSASAPPPTPAISPREMVGLLEQQAAASFPVPWVVVSAVAPSERGVWPSLASRPRHRGRLHPGLCLPRGSDPLTADGAGKALATSPVIRRRSRSKGKEGQGRPFTPPTPDLNSRGFNV